MKGNPDKPAVTRTAYDVVVIGAGVVGCAVARRFTLEGASVLTIEKGTDILNGASKGNSALLHTGFDAAPGSLEQRCIAAGYQEFLAVRERLGLPLLKTGALVIAWSEAEADRLDALMAQAHANGIVDVELLSARQILAMEPRLSKKLVAGFQMPGEFVIDPWSTPYAYLLQAVANGARVLRGTKVTGGHFDGEHWKLATSHGEVTCQTVINCAGLYGDLVDRNILHQQTFDIAPRKGQFVVFDKSASSLLDSIILPVPSESTKGVVVCKTIFGNLLVGPTAEEQDSRDDASVERDTLVALKQRGEAIIPALADCPITATYAGIRPATQSKDFCIEPHARKNYISVGGIRSTGLTAALGIAGYVFGLYEDMHRGNGHHRIDNALWPQLTPIAEHAERDWTRPGNGGIVCHCELVTRREIADALSGPLPATSLAGLKRRTRVTMGRCQGFYCLAELSEMTAGHFDPPIGIDHEE